MLDRLGNDVAHQRRASSRESAAAAHTARASGSARASHIALTMLILVAGCGFFDVGTVETLCNFVNHDTCSSSQACVSPTAPHCAAAGTKTAGEACTLDNDCIRDAICLGADGNKTCLTRCDLAKPTCTGDLECIQATVVSTDDGFGVCTTLACNPFDGTGCPSGERCIAGALPYCTAVIGVGGGAAKPARWPRPANPARSARPTPTWESVVASRSARSRTLPAFRLAARISRARDWSTAMATRFLAVKDTAAASAATR